jgi:hypothetical protein
MMGGLSLEMRARKVERQRQKGPEEIVNLEGEKRKINGEADEEVADEPDEARKINREREEEVRKIDRERVQEGGDRGTETLIDYYRWSSKWKVSW